MAGIADEVPIPPVLDVLSLFRKSTGSEVDVAGKMDFWHYLCSPESDVGWGCAYRCAQMLYTNLQYNGKVGAVKEDSLFPLPPKIVDLQRELARIGRIPESDIGSHRWIEPPDVAALFRVMYDVRMREERVKFGEEEESGDVGPLEVLDAFIKQGLQEDKPVMVDDAVQAFVIGGRRVVEDGEREKVDFAAKHPVGGLDEAAALHRGVPVDSPLHHVQVLVVDSHARDKIVPNPDGTVEGIRWVPFLAFFGRARSKGWMACYEGEEKGVDKS